MNPYTCIRLRSVSASCLLCGTNVGVEFCASRAGWRLQPSRGLLELVSPPLMSSRHHYLEPYGSWHVTIYIYTSKDIFSGKKYKAFLIEFEKGKIQRHHRKWGRPIHVSKAVKLPPIACIALSILCVFLEHQIKIMKCTDFAIIFKLCNFCFFVSRAQEFILVSNDLFYHSLTTQRGKYMKLFLM